MAGSLLHNMLVRELALVVLLVIVLISFYLRYTAAAHREFVRTRERRMALVVHSARRQLVVVVVLLAGVLVYDRVLPHFGLGASAARQTAVSKSHAPEKIKVATSSSKKHSASSRKQAVAASDARVAASKKAASSRMIAASKSAAASRVASASSSRAASQSASQAVASSQLAASSSKAVASSKAAAASVNPKQKAVTAVQQYLTQHPSADRVDQVNVIDYSTDYNGVPAYQVGLYQTQADGSSVAVHMYFAYAGGNVVKAY